MRPRWGLAGIAVLALAASCSSGGTAADPADGARWDVPCPRVSAETAADDFEEFTLECLSDGAEYRLGDIDDRPLVITLWASWCGPCRDEAPAFREFHAKLGDEVNIIGVDTQDDPEAGKSFAADAGWRFPSVVDPDGTVMRAQGISALPATFFIDNEGVTAVTYNKGELTTKQLLAAAKKYFGVTP